MIKVKRLGHLLLGVSDLDVALDFYCRVLGFELVEREGDHHSGMAFLSLGETGHTLDLIADENIDAVRRSVNNPLRHFALQVDSPDDLRDAYFELIDHHNVAVFNAVDHVSQQSVYIHDPDGNVVEIYYELPNALALFRAGREDSDEPLVFTR